MNRRIISVEIHSHFQREREREKLSMQGSRESSYNRSALRTMDPEKLAHTVEVETSQEQGQHQHDDEIYIRSSKTTYIHGCRS